MPVLLKLFFGVYGTFCRMLHSLRTDNFPPPWGSSSTLLPKKKSGKAFKIQIGSETREPMIAS